MLGVGPFFEQPARLPCRAAPVLTAACLPLRPPAPPFCPPVGLLLWLKLRVPRAVSDVPEYVPEKSASAGSASSKRSAASERRAPSGPSGLSMARSASGVSIDLEGARTPRYRQPTAPRRPALKHSYSAGAGGAPTAAAIRLHASATAAAAAVPPPGPRLVPGVHLLPRVPGAGPGAAAGVSAAVARTQAAVVDAQVRGARRTWRSRRRSRPPCASTCAASRST